MCLNDAGEGKDYFTVPTLLEMKKAVNGSAPRSRRTLSLLSGRVACAIDQETSSPTKISENGKTLIVCHTRFIRL